MQATNSTTAIMGQSTIVEAARRDSSWSVPTQYDDNESSAQQPSQG